MEFKRIKQEGWQGQLEAGLDSEQVLGILADLDHQAEWIYGGRNALCRATIQSRDMAIKCFPPLSNYAKHTARGRGTKAGRSWTMAQHLAEAGVGTPTPYGYLDTDDGRSFYLSAWVNEPVSLKDELLRMFHRVTDCAELLELLEVVARGVRSMHEVGLQHNDLGNQNILLEPAEGGGWKDILLIDLNRARIRPGLSIKQRARDVSRLTLPSDIRRVFLEMLFAPEVVPEVFKKAEKRYRLRFALHTISRPIRHPFRTLKQRRQEDPRTRYPSLKDVWIWDARSVQAISPMRKYDRLRFFPMSSNLDFSFWFLRKRARLLSHYTRLKEQAYVHPVKMDGRIAVALEASSASIPHEEVLLKELGVLPVLVRYYHHEDSLHWSVTTAFIRQLKEQGYPITIALVQDRKAVRNPASWRKFVHEVLEATHGMAEQVEIGHAINRAKWGVWSVHEYRDLVRIVHEVSQAFPEHRFVGPAVIDFEYHYLPGALNGHPEGFSFSAISHHLYVDRRGAPENRQGVYSTLDKLAMVRAAAATTPHAEDRLIVSEVNWPLLNTGVYSPVMSPYESPGARIKDPSVDEEDYTDFMLRYYLIALCSGMAHQVFWWRLAAHGFGLVDDRSDQGWRKRSAYHALVYFLSQMRGSVFVRKESPETGIEVFWFEQGPEQSQFAMAYCTEEPTPWMPGGTLRVVDALGEPVGTADSVMLSSRPVYLWPSEEPHA